MFINLLLTLFCLCSLVQSSAFASDPEIDPTIKEVPKRTPQRKKAVVSMVVDDSCEQNEELSSEPKTLEELKKLSVDDVLKRIEEARLPDGVSCWYAYLLILNTSKLAGTKIDFELVAKHCLAQQNFQAEQLKQLQLKARLIAAQKKI